jgi:SNF2 family DNA or RNA helicase
MKRLEPDTLFVRREDVFDVQFDKFVKEPIPRPVELPASAKKIANELVNIGFTDNFTLGRAPALELLIRLQDICNGFEPISEVEFGVEDKSKINVLDEADRQKNQTVYRPFPENPKIDELLELLDEIGTDKNQVAVWCSRKLMIRACKDAFDKEGIAYVVYDGSASTKEKQDAEEKFQSGEARIFLANQASGAYGLNCLSACSYAVYMCVDGSVEKYYQSMHRILRGQLTAPKFAYSIYAKGTVEERQWDLLRVGKELIDTDNKKEKFLCV